MNKTIREREIKMFINRLLRFFGLIKIDLAMKLTKILYVDYVKTVVDGVERDFKVGPAPGYVEATSEWWENEFEKIIKLDTDNIIITSIPMFKEFMEKDEAK